MLEDNSLCHWCLKSGEEYCECEAPKCFICGNVGAIGNLEEIGLHHLGCNHLLAGWEDEYDSPQVLLHINTKGISNEIVETHTWTEKELETAFGNLLPLYHCFKEGEGNVESTKFWDVLTQLIPEIKYEECSFTPPGGGYDWQTEMYCAENPEKVKGQAEVLLQKLKGGYNYLEKLLPENRLKS